MENHTGKDRTVIRTTEGIAAQTPDHTAGRIAEVTVQYPLVCAGFTSNTESRMDLRTMYRRIRNISRQSSNNVIPIVVL
jgi:hypothetical protein